MPSSIAGTSLRFGGMSSGVSLRPWSSSRYAADLVGILMLFSDEPLHSFYESAMSAPQTPTFPLLQVLPKLLKFVQTS
jgi:hypothetical protein